MARVVHKYPVPAGTPVSGSAMSREAEFVHVDVIGSQVWVWALVDLNELACRRLVGYFATGEEIPTGYEHVGSFIVPDGLGAGSPFVGHVFDGGERD